MSAEKLEQILLAIVGLFGLMIFLQAVLNRRVWGAYVIGFAVALLAWVYVR